MYMFIAIRDNSARYTLGVVGVTRLMPPLKDDDDNDHQEETEDGGGGDNNNGKGA